MTHFLDETGNIPPEMPKEARELASFMALVVDETTKLLPTRLTPTEIRCFEKGCNGTTRVEIHRQSEGVLWVCLHCENEGVISEWQGTK